MTDIKSLMNAVNQTRTPTSANTGTISKLESEIKLIENLKLIRIQGSEDLSFQGKPAQLLRASGDNQHFTLINSGTKIPLGNQQSAKISFMGNNQASLTLTSNQTGVARFNNLTIASGIMNLTVLSSKPSGPNTYLADVSDGKNTFQVTTPTPLEKGTPIRAFLDANNNLQVIPAKASGTLSPPLEALKQSLPKQLTGTEMTQLIKQLHTLNSQASSLPPQTQRALSQLIQSLPSLETLTQSPEAMKHAIQTSGPFAESLLKNSNTSVIGQDLKLNLMRLENASQQASQPHAEFPTQQIASAIERITTTQLRHFSDPSQLNAQMFPLQIDLPIKDQQSTHFVQLHIDQDAKSENNKEQDRRWLVKLNFDFPETGRFEARAGIQANKVGIVFAAENPETLKAIKQNMADLKQQLTDKNIEVQRLEAFQTKLQDNKTTAPVPTSLIDVRT